MKQLFQDAKKVIPGGVNSPVRSFGGVGGEPIFIDRAAGAFLYDVGGKAYIDYVGSWGPMILGHAHPQVIEAVKTAADKGLSFGTVTEIETKLAAKVCDLIPSIDMVRMVSSGTEATMSALRLARAYSRRDKIVKFAGNYHGHSDSLLAQAGSGVLTCDIPSSPGVPKSTAADTITLPYNDSEATSQLFAEIGDSIAAVIVEPIAGNMNCIPATTDFLHTLRSCCSEYASVLIFDEVMSGFRVGLDGAQGIYGIQPDLTTLGKIIGGGMPVGAFGGSAKIMQHLAPIGEVYQAGTLSGNPVAMAAGLATLQLLEEANFYESLASKTSQLVANIQLAAAQTGIPFASTSVGGMFGLFFAASKPQNLADAKDCNQQHFRQFFHAMLEQGVYLAPSAFEAGFVSAAHDDDTLAQTSAAALNAFKSLSA